MLRLALALFTCLSTPFRPEMQPQPHIQWFQPKMDRIHVLLSVHLSLSNSSPDGAYSAISWSVRLIRLLDLTGDEPWIGKDDMWPSRMVPGGEVLAWLSLGRLTCRFGMSTASDVAAGLMPTPTPCEVLLRLRSGD